MRIFKIKRRKKTKIIFFFKQIIIIKKKVVPFKPLIHPMKAKKRNLIKTPTVDFRSR